MREQGERVGMQREAVDRRGPEAHDRIGDAVEPPAQGAARRVRLALGEPAHVRAHDQLDRRRLGLQREQCALDAVVARADHGHALAGEILVAAALEHDPHARVVAGGERGRHARERGDAEREHHGARLHLVAGSGRHAHAAVGEGHRGDVVRIALGHERALEPLGVVAGNAAAATAPCARPRRSAPMPRACLHAPEPRGSCAPSRSAAACPAASACATCASARRTSARCHDAMRALRRRARTGPRRRLPCRSCPRSQPSSFVLASAGACARPRLRRRTAPDRAGERDHRCRGRARGPRERRPRPHRRDRGVAPRGRSVARLVLLRHGCAERRRRADRDARDRGMGLPGDARAAHGDALRGRRCMPRSRTCSRRASRASGATT